MSRVGKQPIPIPAGVKVNILPDKIKVEGPKGQLESPLFEGIRVEMKDNQLIFTREKETPKVRAFHGLCRTLAANAIQGVSQGFEKKDIEIVLEKPTLITVRGIDKQRVGQEAYKIRSFRKPDPYKLKGIRYVGERLIKKERRAGVGGV